MPIAPNIPVTSEFPPERMPAGRQCLLWLDAGAEVRCLTGTLRLRPAWLARDTGSLPGEWELHAPRAWRSDRGQWLQVTALRPSTYRLDAGTALALDTVDAAVLPPKRNHPEPRGAGWLLEAAAGGFRRVAACFRRARRAA